MKKVALGLVIMFAAMGMVAGNKPTPTPRSSAKAQKQQQQQQQGQQKEVKPTTPPTSGGGALTFGRERVRGTTPTVTPSADVHETALGGPDTEKAVKTVTPNTERSGDYWTIPARKRISYSEEAKSGVTPTVTPNAERNSGHAVETMREAAPTVTPTEIQKKQLSDKKIQMQRVRLTPTPRKK